MGVILCDSPTGPFAVVVIPKCGSTTVRIMLADVAEPGQYKTNYRRTLIRKDSKWTLALAYNGIHHPRSWAVVRNPWRRLLSRWKEKAVIRPELDWSEYVMRAAELVDRHTMSRPQASYFARQRPTRIVAIENVAEWAPEMERVEGVTLGTVTHARSQGDYDWRQIYRDHPETRDIVRNLFAVDWELGITWEDPLA